MDCCRPPFSPPTPLACTLLRCCWRALAGWLAAALLLLSNASCSSLVLPAASFCLCSRQGSVASPESAPTARRALLSHSTTRYRETPRARVALTIALSATPATNRPFLQNNPNPHQQGLPPPQLQHPRQAGLIQQHRPNSPLQPHGIHHTSQAPYLSPHSSTHSLPQHHSPYVGSVPSLPSQHSADPNYFTAQPSPYSANSAAGSYASSGMLPPCPSSTVRHRLWFCLFRCMHALHAFDP